MSVITLLSYGFRFAFRHSWPLLAIAALFVPVQFGLDRSLDNLVGMLASPDHEWIDFTIRLAYVPVYALANALYYSVLITLADAMLRRTKLTYPVWRSRLTACLKPFFAFNLVFYFVVIESGALSIFPLLAYMLALGYIEIVILFERRGLRAAVNRSIQLVLADPLSAVGVGMARFGIMIALPFLVYASGARYSVFSVVNYFTLVLEVPFYICYLVLFTVLTGGEPPEGLELVSEDDDF